MSSLTDFPALPSSKEGVRTSKAFGSDNMVFPEPNVLADSGGATNQLISSDSLNRSQSTMNGLQKQLSNKTT